MDNNGLLSAHRTEAEAAQVRACVQRIIRSDAFRSSRRCQEFLHFIAASALKGEARLKERSIAIELFGKAVTYSTAEDSTVRVTAHEVRRRLATYYAGEGKDDPVRLVLPAGSYHPEFSMAAPVQSSPPVDASQSANQRQFPWLLILAVLIGCSVVAGAAFVILYRPHPKTALDQFWAPVAASNEPALVCLGEPAFFVTRKDAHRRLLERVPSSQKRPFRIQTKPEDAPWLDLWYMPQDLVGVGDALATYRISALLTRMQKPNTIKAVGDVPFSELGRYPTILIGAFSNLWTMQTVRDFRFRFETRNGVNTIVDPSVVGSPWQPSYNDGLLIEDYALITRVADHRTNQVTVALAGVTQFGTGAAAELVTDVKQFSDLTHSLPAGWERKNLQLLIRVKVVDSSPGLPTAVRLHSW